MTLCGFLPDGKKNCGTEGKRLANAAPAEGRHDVVWFFVRREEEPRERRNRVANMAPAEGRHDAMQVSAGREEELWQRRNRACEYGHPPRGKFSLKPGVSVVAGFCFVC